MINFEIYAHIHCYIFLFLNNPKYVFKMSVSADLDEIKLLITSIQYVCV